MKATGPNGVHYREVPCTVQLRSSPMCLDLSVGKNVGGPLEKLVVEVDWEGVGTGLLDKNFCIPDGHRG